MFYIHHTHKRLCALILCLLLALSVTACTNASGETSILKDDYTNSVNAETISPDVQSPDETVSPIHTGSEDPSETVASETSFPKLEVNSESSKILSDSNGFNYYVATLQNDEKDITVSANAPINVPRTDNLSVYSVKQAPFKQDFIDKVRSVLFGDTPIYDGVFLALKSNANNLFKSISETGSKALIAEYQKQLDDLLPKEYQDPSKIVLQNFTSDGLITKTKDSYAEKPYYKWQNQMYPDGEYLFVINDGSDGVYHSLTVYNDPNRSNRLVYKKNNLVHNDINTPYITKEVFEKAYGDLNGYINNPQYVAEPKYHIDYSGSYNFKAPVYIPEDDGLDITFDEAILIAHDFLKEIGINDFACYQNEIAKPDLCRVLNTDAVIYREVYKLTFYRLIDGIPLTQSSGDKHNEFISGPDGASYSKKYWYGESIVLHINDDGIVEFVYNSPLEITDTISSNITVKPFEEIKELFESVMLSDANREKNVSRFYNVQNVRLSYSRVSNGISNYETGLIMPMWDFSGTCVMSGNLYYETPLTTNYAPLLAINAVDGSVIHPRYGYN